MIHWSIIKLTTNSDPSIYLLNSYCNLYLTLHSIIEKESNFAAFCQKVASYFLFFCLNTGLFYIFHLIIFTYIDPGFVLFCSNVCSWKILQRNQSFLAPLWPGWRAGKHTNISHWKYKMPWSDQKLANIQTYFIEKRCLGQALDLWQTYKHIAGGASEIFPAGQKLQDLNKHWAASKI